MKGRLNRQEAGKGKLINLHEYEVYLQNNLKKTTRDYYHSGSNDMITLRENRLAFSRLCIQPKVLKNVSEISTSTTILGRKYDSPICIAPSAMQKMCHPDGEIGTSRAASRFKTVMTLSSLSTTSIEDVFRAPEIPPTINGPGGSYWFQLYAYKNKEITLDLIQRAERSGYEAIVLTVDTPMLGRREPDLRNQFSLPSHLSLENFSRYYENFQKQSSSSKSTPSPNTLTMNSRPTLATSDPNNNSAISNYFALLINDALTWDETIMFIRENTKLKIILKGIMNAADAIWALQYPVDGIWVSNHGARQLDTTPATIEVLPEIAAVIQQRIDIYFDGGITRGTDILKAIALGANAVFLGRPVLWGLTYDGEQGVVDILEILQEELVLAMKLAGCTTLSQLHKGMIRPKLVMQSRL